MDKATEFILEQQGKHLQKNFDNKKETIANMLKLDTIDKYRGQMMHIAIAEWCEPFLAKMMGEEPYNIEDIVTIDDADRQIIFQMMEEYWKINNLKGNISFHKDDNSVVLQMMCYAQQVEPFGFSVYDELSGGLGSHQYKDWYKVLERMVNDAKNRVWLYITTSI